MREATPAETLRKAAELMRKRAKAATPDPWTTRERHGRDIADEGYSDVRVASDRGDVAIAYLTGVIESGYDDAEYIASMSPLVGLALAKWLTTEAGRAAGMDGWEDSDAYPAWLDTFSHSLAIARAYLGEVSDV